MFIVTEYAALTHLLFDNYMYICMFKFTPITLKDDKIEGQHILQE